jgi:uncharacterized protein
MLVSSDADELALLSDRYAESRNATNRFVLTLVTSLGCNFDCPYCFEAKHPSLMDERVEKMVLEAVADQLARGIEILAVCWFGGEPLIGIKPLTRLGREFVQRAERAGAHYDSSIITNGYLLSREVALRLAEIKVTHAQVCLDGPPDTHNLMRPRARGGGSFDRIVDNICACADVLGITVRMNIDRRNVDRAEELFQILAARGLAGKVGVVSGHLVAVDDGNAAPSSSYHGCLTGTEYAATELEFDRMAAAYGFARPGLPEPNGAPCTAVRANELVVGSKGELYKCWESVGNPSDVIGHIRDYQRVNSRVDRWLRFDPFEDAECRSCIALPVCMGGCAHHAMDELQYETRCDSFRLNFLERVKDFTRAASTLDDGTRVPVARLARQLDGR